MSSTTVRKVVAAGAAYDLIVTAPLATPWTARWLSAALARLHEALALPGAPPALDPPLALLFANLLGTIVVLWSLVRLARPTALHGGADTAGRLLFASWMAYALAQGASGVLAGFLVLELGWAVAQAVVLSRTSWPARAVPA